MARETDLNKVVAALQASLQKPLPDTFIKAWTQSASATSGITAYSLEEGAKILFPVLTPLRNSIPRVGGGTGTAENWRAVTAINSALMEIGVSEGNRSGVVAHTTADYTAAYRGLGLEDSVTFEADYAGKTFDDVRALAVSGLLHSLMIGEEQVILGGNTSLALGTTPTPTLAASSSGGTLASMTLSVICVALTQSGVYTGSVSGGVRASVTRTNADGTTDTYGGGAAQKSANATIAVTGPTGSATATTNVVTGACGYAWFWGVAGSEVLGAITTINSVAITANATGTQTAASLPSSDQSKNALVFDGLLTQTFANGYFVSQATGTAGTGTPLTGGSDGGIAEFDVALQHFWDVLRLSPQAIWVSSQEQKNITKKILAATSTAAQRFVFDVNQGRIMGGSMVVSYLNKFGMSGGGGAFGAPNELPIMTHPNLPAGTVLFQTKELPYKLSNVSNVAQIKTRREYYQLEWPLTTRKYEYGVYADEVLQNYFPSAFGVINNIGNG